jgi:hypothetical protein
MSDCIDENGALDLVEGKLSAAARANVERHLESCDACRELVAELARVVGEEKAGAVDTERAPSPRPGTLTHVGPYRLDREVGSGSAGTVFRAIDERSGAVVAIKHVTDPSWRNRFGREVETLARLAHPGIVRYVGHGETPFGMYLAMEWLEGEDLQSCLARGPLPWTAVRTLGLRLTAALAHAHALGAVHRDLTPRNVFLPGGRVDQAKLLDFGLVRIHDELARTSSQAVLGTPYYMAPEQVKNPKLVDARADLFSLGVVFFEALSGARPFVADELFSLWRKIVEEPTPDLRRRAANVPEAFVRLVERLLAKDATARPASAAEVHQALVHMDGSSSPVETAVVPPMRSLPAAPPPVFVAPAPSHPPYVAPPQPSRGVGLVIGAVLGVALLLVVSAAIAVAYVVHQRQGDVGAREAAPQVAPSVAPTAPTVAASESETFFCGGESTESRRGQTYRAEADGAPAVTVSGMCKATLEDCTIDGRVSVTVVGKGELTLRRCRVHGEVHLVGDVTLTLEKTVLPKSPTITGKARVIRR